jgi:hypothetical protein
MGWLRAAWTGASGVQKIVILAAGLLAVGAVATIASPSPSAIESPGASTGAHATLTEAENTPSATPSATPQPTPTQTPFPTPVPTAVPTPVPTPIPTPVPTPVPTVVPPAGNCDPAYPSVCIPPPPPDLDCGEISFRNFTVLPPDPHGFDGDNDGIGCES